MLTIEHAPEKRISSWLTSLPLADFGFVLNKQEFNITILLRYNFKVKEEAAACGEQNTVIIMLSFLNWGVM